MRTKEDVINGFMKDIGFKVNAVYNNGYEAGYKACEAEKTCITCKWWRDEPIDRGHVCCNGHSIHVADWRQKYDCCDLWEHK